MPYRPRDATSRLAALAVAALALVPVAASAGPVAYDLRVRLAFLQAGDFTQDAGPTINVDAGVVTFFNAGTSTFTGTLSLSGYTGGSAFTTLLETSLAGGLAPGEQRVLTLADNPRSEGGFNPTLGDMSSPNLGILIRWQGSVSDGAMTDFVDLQVLDSQVHSGNCVLSPLTMPDGSPLKLDTYILQGGDPFGRFPPDDFAYTNSGAAVHQSEATFRFANPPPPSGPPLVPGPPGCFCLVPADDPAAAVPEPATWLLLSAAALALARRRLRTAHR